jgi:hypothetical protein
MSNSGKGSVGDVNLPVKAMDPQTNYYGKPLRMSDPVMSKMVDDSFANSNPNMVNGGEDDRPAKHAHDKETRLAAMKRRMQKAY